MINPHNERRSKNIFDTSHAESKLEDSPNFRRGHSNKKINVTTREEASHVAQTLIGGEGRVSEASDSQKILFFPVGAGQ